MSQPADNEIGAQGDLFESYEIRSLGNLLRTDLSSYALKILVRLPLHEFAILNVAQYIWYSLRELLRKDSFNSEEEEFLSQLVESAVFIPSLEIREQLYILLDQTEGTVQKNVLYALSRVKDEKALPALMELVTDPDNETRRTDAYYLAYHDITSEQDRVEELCYNDPAGDLRFWLAVALARIGENDGLIKLLDDYKAGSTIVEIFSGDPSTITEQINRLGGLSEKAYSDQRLVAILEEDNYLNTVFEKPFKSIPLRLEKEIQIDEEKKNEALQIAESILGEAAFNGERLHENSEALSWLPDDYKPAFITKLFKKIMDTAPTGMPQSVLGNYIMELPSSFWINFKPEITPLYQLYISNDNLDYGFQHQIIWTMTRAGLRPLITELTILLDEAEQSEKKIILEIIYESLGYRKTSYAPLFGGSTMKEYIQPKATELVRMGVEFREEMVGPPGEEGLRIQPKKERYADFAFYGEDFELVKKDHPLYVDTGYNLEVAIRKNRLGIQPEEPFPKPLIDPTKGEPVEIIVALESSDFEIEQPVQTLTLPPEGDSIDNAWFRVKAFDKTSSKLDRSRISVRMYYSLYLIEVAHIDAEIIPKGDDLKSRIDLKHPITFRQSRLEYNYGDFSKIISRAMNIDIEKRKDHYIFNFIVKTPEVPWKKVALSAPVFISTEVLEDRLLSIRNSLNEITTSKTFQNNVSAKKTFFKKTLRNLAMEGRGLWVDLFRENLDSSMAKIGSFLKENPIVKDGLIQITVENDSADFVFPWALIFDGEIPEEQWKPIDIDGFWGIRYDIEQKFPPKEGIKFQADMPIILKNEAKLNFFLWDSFHNSNEHIKLLQELQDRSNGKLIVSNPPITDTKVGYQVLEEGQSEILYFYTHGFVKPRKDDTSVDYTLNYYLRQIEEMEKTDEAYEYYKKIYEDLKEGLEESERSWIKLRNGSFYLNKMKDRLDEFSKKPIVILNMCNSAKISPTLSDNFVWFFHDRGAISILGTECPMTPLFAHNFGKIFLEYLLKGEKVGTALLESRRHFMNKSNPCGLAYTLYGSATAHFTPNPLQ